MMLCLGQMITSKAINFKDDKKVHTHQGFVHHIPQHTPTITTLHTYIQTYNVNLKGGGGKGVTNIEARSSVQ